MGTIHLLSPGMINKIAAGEVIERPANIVKELVENSIDAGATRIEIEIEKSGLDLIRIVDNGSGIPREEIPLALSPHATSKVSETSDLFNIQTLGFRGEALASIAEVTQLILRSRPENSPEGTEIRADGGQFSESVPCGMPQGTLLEIRNLFFNIPVRRKFLKSATTEYGHISEVVTRMALSHLGVHFLFKHNGRVVNDLPPVVHLPERVRKLFGSEIADKLIRIENRRGEVHVSGFVSHPDLSRPNYAMQYLFMNRRFIRDRSLQHALGEAYRGLLPVGRNPIAFLQIDLPPDAVDVNVHPMKLEVRFVNANAVYAALLGAIREEFLRTNMNSMPKLDTNPLKNDSAFLGNANLDAIQSGPTKGSETPDDNDPRHAMDDGTSEEIRNRILDWANGDLCQAQTLPSGVIAPDSSRAESNEKELLPLAGPGVTHGDSAGSVTRLPDDVPAHSAVIPPFMPFPDHHSSIIKPAPLNHQEPLALNRIPPVSSEDSPAQPTTFQEVYERNLSENEKDLTSSAPESTAQSSEVNSSAEKPVSDNIVQIHQRYLVMETRDGLAIIDQHAMHERILYEKLKAEMLSGKLDSQGLLVPAPVDLTPAEVACALENKEILARFGLVVDSFGGNTILISGYPAIIRHTPPEEILFTLLTPLMDAGKIPDRSDLFDGMMHQMACKAAVKAGDKLSDDSMRELIELARAEINSHHCPHGRPSTLLFSCQELDKLFKRT